MVFHNALEPDFKAIRTLVRYVDEERAVIEVHVEIDPGACAGPEQTRSNQPMEVQIQMIGPAGQVFTHQSRVQFQEGTAAIRFEMEEPLRWWPAGMGDQTLYDLIITILSREQPLTGWRSTLGLTSVRKAGDQSAVELLVNGRKLEIRSVLAVEPIDEHNVLPVAENSLLVVRDHFAPDVLFDATDRAGILLIQSIPLSHGTEPDVRVRQQVNRLATHPSLAGWLVERADRFGDRLVRRLRLADPTRHVFREMPS